MILMENAYNVNLEIILIIQNLQYANNNFLDVIMSIANVFHVELHFHTIQQINLVPSMDVYLTF